MAMVPAAIALVVLVMIILLRRSFVAAEPDEWLLRIRNGRLLNAGIGISLFRKPGEVLARFSSTIQRVKFCADALSREHVPVKVDGFLLWSVSPEPERAFRAFNRLGIANLERAHHGLRNAKHLLTSPQHHAFQALLAAEVQHHMVGLKLDDILADQDSLTLGIAARLKALSDSLGFDIVQLELSQVRPADESLLREMSAASQEAVRKEATRARMEATEQIKQLEIESATRVAAQESRARFDRELSESRARLDAEREQAELQAAAAELEKARLQAERDLALARLEAGRAVDGRQSEIEHEQALHKEQRAASLAAAVLQREEMSFAARIDQTHRQAIADRDAMLERVSAEERKSQAVREHELARQVTDRVADAMASFHEPQWITIGSESPTSAMAGMVLGMKEIFGRSGQQRDARQV
ncbi:MAG: hypothetical protein HY898_09000 [Deltaproteobacteria bacterium]|nr:hypothetical protein [Deltaproteobacteria bacterium]